jgi:hypothetical protein
MEAPYSDYSEAEYLADVKRSDELQMEYWHPSERRQILDVINDMLAVEEKMRLRLPIYVIGRCPFCGGRIWESIDTFSLNGPIWRKHTFKGVGWFGPLDNITPEDQQKYAYFRLYHGEHRPSFEAECDHIQCLDWFVNLDGQEPLEVRSFSERTEVPHLVLRLMNDPGTLAVLHMLPLRRIDAQAGARPYKIFFMTYFSKDRNLMQRVLEPLEVSEPVQALRVLPPWDDELVKWVKKGRLYWLNEQGNPVTRSWFDTQGKPVSQSVEETFPYGNLTGYKAGFLIKDGKIKYPRSLWRMLCNWLGW